MPDFINLLGPLPKWLWKYFEKAMRDALTFSAELQYDREKYVLNRGFIPVKINVRPGLLQTRLKAVCAAGCTLCPDEEYLGKCGAVGQWRHRPRKNESQGERLELINCVAPARADALPAFPFVIWIRPEKEMEEITIKLRTSSWIQPPPYIIVLGESNV